MSFKDAIERVRKSIEDLRSGTRSGGQELRKITESIRPELPQRFLEQGGPVRKAIEGRPTFLIKEPLLKRLRRHTKA